MELKAGTLEDHSDSMAEAIEKAFERVWKSRYGTSLPEETKGDRRILFVAIAQGVIKHLKDNANDAFYVKVNVRQTEPLIKSSGKTEQINWFEGWNHEHEVYVTQDDVSGNKIKSKGEGKEEISVEILTRGEIFP